ncbi:MULTISPECIES: gluconate permease GntP [Corynebacterium]|uniref:gluconate permease GntP n=1 Tax=Corynebacterium TaxID=1716 RepID=UPI0008A5F50E|nr:MULTISPECIES: gluconate permease GntP [Corynebacterium]MCT1563764.1 gluconate permease GntP [Corynebacterium glucuronolyticum]OFO47951.1 gluconate permease [Corynebacterium sp. HMSC073D01]
MHIMWVVLGIALMLVLNMKFKVNAMVSLLIAALTIGFLERMGPAELLETIQTGFGSTLGSLAIIVVFGAVIGKLMVDSGAATRLADTLIEKFGVGKVKVAMVIVGLVFGLAMFYEVAFIILAPLIIAVAVEAKVPFLKIAIPAVAATTTAHSLFPPQPGPVALVDAYGADTGMVYIYALIVAIPTVIITGWVLPRFLGDLDRPVPKLMRPDEDIPADQRPSFALSLFVPLIPAIVMISATITKAFISEDSAAYEWVSFIGSSIPAMAIALIAAIYFFGIKQGRSMEWTMGVFKSAVKGIAMVILIIGAGGALKQVIIDSGVGDYIGSLMTATSISPYIMAWAITVLIRLATGQGVVSAMTAAGIISAALMDPVTGTITAVNPALLVVATAAGSNTLTHVNDASFWLFKGYFDLSVKDTLKTWGLLQLCNSIVGLVVVMGISVLV